MKTFSILAVLSVLTFSSAFAQHGDKGGNGGVSVVCRDSQNKIISAQLLDTYEAEVRDGKKFDNKRHEGRSVEDQVNSAKLKLAKFPKLFASFLEEYEIVVRNMTLIPNGNILRPTNDAFPLISKQGCEFEQLANYTERGDIIVSAEIYGNLGNADKAGLVIHEVVYSLLRQDGATDSRGARRVTAELLATNSSQEAIDAVLAQEFGTGTIKFAPSKFQSSKNKNVWINITPVNPKDASFNAWAIMNTGRATLLGSLICRKPNGEKLVCQFTEAKNDDVQSIELDSRLQQGLIKFNDGTKAEVKYTGVWPQSN